MPDTFPVTPARWSGSPGAYEARVLRSQFGDGYTQRAADGINSIAVKWSMSWRNLTQTEKAAIQTFLETKAGATVFYWTPPRESTPLLWTCKSWSCTPVPGLLWNISAEFIREFDIVGA